MALIQSLTSFLVKSSTYCSLPLTPFLPGTLIIKSGCSLYRLVSSLIISGSNQIPSFISIALIRSDNSLRDDPSFFSFTFQSPSPLVSSYLSPNQPSSITSISIPRLFAFDAILKSLSASKSKYVASQLLISIGL